MASSPLVVGDTVIVQMENQGESFAAGLDVATGQTRWQIDRELDATWTSPAVLRTERAEDDMVLLQSRSWLTAHRPRTGELIWKYETSCHTVATLTTCGDTVYLPANGLHALRYDPTTCKVKLLWYERKLRSGNSSPVVHEGRAYVLKPPGILVCGDAADGTVLWQLRLKGPFWSTAVIADQHLYAVNHDGLVQVVRLGEEGELVGSSRIDAGILASPAIADGAIYFRSDDYLWKVAFVDTVD
jgi:outer membrane protein assembly factor BamB